MAVTDRVAVLRIAGKHGHVGRLVPGDGVEVTEFELGHAAAGFLVDDHVGDVVVRQHTQQVVADAGLVVVDVAGGEDRHLAGRALPVRDDGGRALRRAPAEALRGQLGHPGVRVHAQGLVHQLARGLRAVDRIDRLHHHRDAGKAAMHVGRGEELLARLHFTLAVLDRLGAQHQVREVEVPLVRRRVRTLGHVAQVAQITLVDDAPVRALRDAMHFAVVGLVDQIEQGRKALAQAHAAAAAMADVEHPLHLGKRLGLVVEVGVAPVDGMAGRGFEVAFTHGGSPVRAEKRTRGP